MKESGNIFCYIALFGLIPVIVGMFALLPPRRAALWGYLLAVMFLPMVLIAFHNLFYIDKWTAAGGGVLLGMLIFDSGSLFSFRPRIWDLPALVWCLCPIATSLHNGLGLYDGLATAGYVVVQWGVPYLIGRVYFNDLPGLRELAVGIVMGGLIYVPLCLWEVRFSPQLHRIVYGFYQHTFNQVRRDNSFRPMVFMQHGLAVGMWMASATITCFWLASSKIVRRIWGVPIWAHFLLLLGTTLLCRSFGAIILMLGGIGLLIATRVVARPVFLLMLVLVPPTYMFVRATGMWTGDDLVKTIDRYSHDRSSSLKLRLHSEGIFVRKAEQSLLYGWGGFNRFFSVDEYGHFLGIPDAMWIIALGQRGLIGLVSFTLIFMTPILLLMWKIPARYWHHPGAAPAVALAVVLGICMVDNLMNAMFNSVFVLGAGGLCGLAFSMRNPQAATQPVPGRQRSAPQQSLPMAAARA